MNAVLERARAARDALGSAQSRAEALARWFSGSVITDDDGAPLVMYHGTYKDFSAFDRLASAWRGQSIDMIGSWFTHNPGAGGAEIYASGPGAAIYPVYLKVKRPRYFETFGEMVIAMHEAEGRDPAEHKSGKGSPDGLRELLKSQGYDGIALSKTNVKELEADLVEAMDAVRRAKDEEWATPKSERAAYTAKRQRLEETASRIRGELAPYGGSTEFDEQMVVIVFEPEQIKSAIGNRGTFDPGSSSIIDSIAQLDGLSAIERARTAASLNARLSDLPGSTGLARLRLAREIRELVEKLGGGAAESPQNTILREIVAGRHDHESLAELFGMIQENIGQDDFELQHAAVTHWAELESGEKAGTAEPLPLKQRMGLAAELMRLNGRIERADAESNINLAVMTRRRATSLRRALLGKGDAHDIFMSQDGHDKLREALAGIEDMAPAEKIRTAHYVRAIAHGMRVIALAESRNDSSATVIGAPPDILAVCDSILGAPGSRDYERADPVVDDCITVGAFGEQGRERLAIAAAKANGAQGSVDKLTLMLAAKWESVKAEQAERYKVLQDKYRRIHNDITPEDYSKLAAEYNDWVREVFSPVSEAEAARMKSARDNGKLAFAEAGQPLIDKVLEASPITVDQAKAWAAEQVITPQAVARLRKIGYPAERVRVDMADFYRFTGGRVMAVRVHSNGSRRANATDIEAHGKVGTINLDSSFDRRVLWHELAHHMEADPVAKAAAGRFIRRRSVDGKAYSLRSLTGNNGYRADEAAFKGGFFSPYVGKIYRDGITEVFAMGVESFSDPEMLARRAVEDPQTLEFIAGFVSRPMDPLARAHMGIREILREMEEGSAEAREDFVGQRIAEMAAGVTLIEDTDRSWMDQHPVGWLMREMKQLGRFEAGGHYLMAGKVRNWATKRKSNGLIIVNPSLNSIHRMEYPTTDVNVAKAAIGYWERNGVLPSYSSITSEKTLRELK